MNKNVNTNFLLSRAPYEAAIGNHLDTRAMSVAYAILPSSSAGVFVVNS